VHLPGPTGLELESVGTPRAAFFGAVGTVLPDPADKRLDTVRVSTHPARP
jgi:hypothetical protein